MKTSALIMVAVASCLLLVVSPSAAFAGVVPNGGVVPEPSAMLIWAGIAVASGAAYWWHKRRAG